MEVLSPDFNRIETALKKVMDAGVNAVGNNDPNPAPREPLTTLANTTRIQQVVIVTKSIESPCALTHHKPTDIPINLLLYHSPLELLAFVLRSSLTHNSGTEVLLGRHFKSHHKGGGGCGRKSEPRIC